MAQKDSKKAEKAVSLEADSLAEPQPPRVAAPKSIRGLQERTMEERNVADELFPTQLVVMGGDDIVIYHVDLPLSVLVALLDPAVPDGFIRVKVQSSSRALPIPNSPYRFLHTSQIREVVFSKKLPEGALRGEL